MANTPKAESVDAEGVSDGWRPEPGYLQDMGPGGRTQLVVSVPEGKLLEVHTALAKALAPPLGVLYRQVVDRRDPKPQGAPPRDFVALDLPVDMVTSALARFTNLIHHDARCELWLRGALGDQVILDPDGLLFCQPDDPAFRDVLDGLGLKDGVEETLADRDYVKHWFHGEYDVQEDGLIATLQLTEVAHRA